MTDWIQRLNLSPHPEGGYYRETYRSGRSLPAAVCGPDFDGSRSVSTAIYYLLKAGQVSKFHRIRSDEIWHFHDGAALLLHGLEPGRGYFQIRLGRDPGGVPQAVMPAGAWFAAELAPGHSAADFALVGCTVAPGFDFRDFEMADPSDLVRHYPAQSDLIRRISGMGS